MSRLRFEIHSYWHAGTGRGDGAVADAVVLRDDHGLPYLPGRTVKGLLRDAVTLLRACDASVVSADEITDWFGTEIAAAGGDREKRLEQARFRTEQGALRFSNAELGGEWRQWAASPASRSELALLSERIASTCIDENGVADDHTLRAIEVTVPMELSAQLEGLTERSEAVLRQAVSLIRGLGSHRNRGLGRVSVKLEGK